MHAFPYDQHSFLSGSKHVAQVVPDICLPMVAPGKGLQEMMLLQDHARLWGNEVEFTGMAPS